MSKRRKYTIKHHREMKGHLHMSRYYAEQGLDVHAKFEHAEYERMFDYLSAITFAHPSLCTDALVRKMRTETLSN